MTSDNRVCCRGWGVLQDPWRAEGVGEAQASHGLVPAEAGRWGSLYLFLPSVSVSNAPWLEVYKINHIAKLRQTAHLKMCSRSLLQDTGKRIWTHCSISQNIRNSQSGRHQSGMWTAVLLVAADAYLLLHLEGSSRFSIMHWIIYKIKEEKSYKRYTNQNTSSHYHFPLTLHIQTDCLALVKPAL